LSFCVRGDKDFLGAAALRERGAPERRLVCVVLDDPRSVALGNEPVAVDGRVVGRVTSGGYGYTVGRSIAYAYLPVESSAPGTAVDVEIFGEWVEGEVAREPLFDADGGRVRAATMPRSNAYDLPARP
jgi:4-methylaminobutanoate oxidase (formaldehyde-forming)